MPRSDLRDGHREKFPELSIVALTRPLHVEGGEMPVGARGTVVAAYRDGLAYEVEFFEPFHCVATVEGSFLTA
jgi:hypothetical protein